MVSEGIIWQMLASTVQRFPDKTAIISKGTAVTYRSFLSEAEITARALAGLGVKRGDRVCLYLGNRLEFIYIHFAILRLGAVVVPINVTYRRNELKHILVDSGARFFFTDHIGWSNVSEAKPELPGLRIVIIDSKAPPEGALSLSSLKSSEERLKEPVIGPDDLAAVIYTSGTTGRSKGAMLTHGNFTSNIRDLAGVWKWTNRDRLLLGLPMFHVHGLGVVLHGVVYTGGSIVLMERFKAEEAMRLISEYQCNVFMGVPTMYQLLLGITEPQRYDLSQMRLFVSGSAPLPVKVWQQFREKYGFEIVERYGLTETIMNTSNPLEGARKAGSVGKALPSVEVRVVDEGGRGVHLGEVGEILVSGPNVMRGYWNMEDATREALVEGWFRTGDLGYFDEDGYLWITGRKKEMIIVGGFKVYPREVEEVLCAHPKVTEAAVLGGPDELKGEVVRAFVVAQPGDTPSERELIEYCGGLLASFKVPVSIQVIDRMPKTASGKILKGDLLDLGGHAAIKA